jgi:hypothetical protein
MHGWIWVVVIGIGLAAAAWLTLRKSPDTPKPSRVGGLRQEQEPNMASTPEEQRGMDPSSASVEENRGPDPYEPKPPRRTDWATTGSAPAGGNGRAQWIENWNAIQSQFVDDPQDAVRQGDGIVQEILDSIEARRATLRHSMEQASDTESRRAAFLEQRDFLLELSKVARPDD